MGIAVSVDALCAPTCAFAQFGQQKILLSRLATVDHSEIKTPQ
jgi:hypothetical protein